MPKKPVNKKIPKKTAKPKIVPLSNVFKLSYKSIEIIVKNWKIFSILSGVYFLLTLLFVRGFSSAVNVSQYKDTYVGNHAKPTAFGTDFSAFGNVISTSFSSSSGNGGLFQTILLIMFSLIFIWVLRQLLKGQKVNVSDSFYKSQYPFIQFLVVLFFLIIELIPMTIGLFLYATVFTNGIAVNPVEKVVWFLIALAFAALSLYFLVASLFAIYIVTLPNVRPIQAIKSSWNLVKGRRMIVLRKVLFLPIALIIAITLISLLFVAIIPQISDFVFFALSILALLVVQSYLYALYRELI